MSQTRLRKDNRRRLLQALVENGPTSRSRLSEHLHLTQAAISRLVREMIEAHVLEEGEKISIKGRSGPQFVRVGFATQKLFVVGLGLEAFSQVIVIADLNGQIIDSCKLGITSFSDVGAFLDRTATQIFAMLHGAGIPLSKVVGVGAAVVGIVDRVGGRVLRSSHLGWVDVPLASELHKRTGIPVVVENLLHSTNLAEHAFGVSKGCKNVLLVRTSLSVGASLIVDRKLARGARSKAGQISHVPVADGKALCTCGATGCLESEASGRAILARFEARVFRDLAAEEVGSLSERLSKLLERAHEDGSHAQRTVFESGHILGKALEWPVVTLDPECLVLSGPIARHPAYIEGVRAGLGGHVEPFEDGERTLKVSHMPIHEVALRLTISEFLMSRDLDLEKLCMEESETKQVFRHKQIETAS